MGQLNLRDVSPFMLILLVAFAALAIVTVGMLLTMTAGQIGMAVFAVGGVALVASPVLGLGLWWGIHNGYLPADV